MRDLPMRQIMLRLLLLGLIGLAIYGLALSTLPLTAAPRTDCTSNDQDNYVYHPDRLQVLDQCLTMSGMVANVIEEDDGDLHIRVTLDPPYQHYLTSANANQHGDLVVEPVCVISPTYAPAIPVCAADPHPMSGPFPSIGQHVVMQGRYVLDLEHGGWAELHPLYQWSDAPVITPTATISPTAYPLYLPYIQRAAFSPIMLPTNTPTPTETPLPPPSPSETPSSTPRPTSTNSPEPTAVPQPPGQNLLCTQQGSIQLCASVSNASPSQNSTETVYGRLIDNGRGVESLPMHTVWNYKTTTSSCDGVTGSDGLASCSRNIGRASLGYTVSIGVQVTYNGTLYTARTSFTPQ